jgi:predicted AlkP superfamily phosphohydrolase/phosphomutase
MAVPRGSGEDPFSGAARDETVAPKVDSHSGRVSVERPAPEHPEVVVIGIDGMDPDILRDVVAESPELMTNFSWLMEINGGVRPLATSTPPQSPVAWSSFITGLDPGGHGVFDFIHRDPMTRGVVASTTVTEDPSAIGLWGDWQIPLGGDTLSNRSGLAFWSILADHQIPADIWRMPANFPVEESQGWSFSGMMTPALDSAYGECTYYTTAPQGALDLSYKKMEYVIERENGVIDTHLKGPSSPFEVHAAPILAPLRIAVDREAGAVAIRTDSGTAILRPGQWSDFVPVTFALLPAGAMDLAGIVRFYLRRIDPEIEIYASPVNIDPLAPAVAISEPEVASKEVAERIGRYYTQGMPEDVNALKHGVLSDAEFMQQAELEFIESKDMLDLALDRFLQRGKGGVLFFYFSTVDLCSHMMWRHGDATHPAHDATVASEDSSWWSGRSGSTWKETVHDLYRRMDPVIGRLRERLGDDVTLIVMSDHGFAPFRRKFSLNTWLYENGYLVLRSGHEKEQSRANEDRHEVNIVDRVIDDAGRLHPVVDWSRTTAYGVGFNGLYLNRKGRELDDPATDEDESGIIDPADSTRILREIKLKLEAITDEETGLKPILRCDLARDVYHGDRIDEAPDMLVGFNAGYGNADPASIGRILSYVLEDNTGGTFNGSHLMAPDVVAGMLLSNQPVREGEHGLQDLTVEILAQYGIAPAKGMAGHRVLQ